MNSLFDASVKLPIDPNGRSPMQPVCARRLRAGGENLVAGARRKNLESITKALDEIAPLLSCQFHNGGLPCGAACQRDVEKVLVEYQLIVLRRS